MKQKKGFRARVIIYLCIVVIVALLNGAAWYSTAFSDWYIAWIFPVWVNTYGRLTGIFPFSVGEWLIAAGVVLVALGLLLGLLWAGIGLGLACRLVLRKIGGLWFYDKTRGRGRKVGTERDRERESERETDREREADRGRNGDTVSPQKGKSCISGIYKSFCVFSKGFYRFFIWTVLGVCLIMTLNCFILYHASTFSEHYFGEDDGDYTLEELIAVYNMVAEQCNRLAELMDRDETGMVLYNGSIGKNGDQLDMADMARELMAQLGESYPQLDGYYPRPKALISSDFMCQQYMQGYYFPFSMEANYNDVMHILNIPSTMCHELAHLRGYIYEDEANFIAYLACVQSEDLFFQYAGYLSILVYLNNNIYYAWRDNRDIYEEAIGVIRPVTVEEQVWMDNIFVTQEEWDRINAKALIDTEIVDKAADLFIDTNLKINGVSDGKVSYSRVVRLLLQYYRIHGLPV